MQENKLMLVNTSKFLCWVQSATGRQFRSTLKQLQHFFFYWFVTFAKPEKLRSLLTVYVNGHNIFIFSYTFHHVSNKLREGHFLWGWWSSDDGRQTNVAPNTLCKAVLNVSADAIFISVEARGVGGWGEQDAASDGRRPCFAALTWLALCVKCMQGTSTRVIMH